MPTIDPPWHGPIALGPRTCRFCGKVHHSGLDPDSCPVLAEEARRKPVDDAFVAAMTRLFREPRVVDPQNSPHHFPPDADLWQFEIES